MFLPITSINEVQNLFTEIGGVFCTSAIELQQRVEKIKILIFDWDGVFNEGIKHDKKGSGFSEPDSMGTNLLRFSYWLKNKSLPQTVIITGEENESALLLAKREHFTTVYFKATNKLKSLEDLLKTFDLKAEEVAFFYDDVIDIGVAQQCGIRIAMKRRINPLFNNYIINQGAVDYLTSCPGGKHAVREACELLMGLQGNYNDTISHRVRFSDEYQRYLIERKAVDTQIRVGLL